MNKYPFYIFTMLFLKSFFGLHASDKKFFSFCFSKNFEPIQFCFVDENSIEDKNKLTLLKKKFETEKKLDKKIRYVTSFDKNILWTKKFEHFEKNESFEDLIAIDKETIETFVEEYKKRSGRGDLIERLFIREWERNRIFKLDSSGTGFTESKLDDYFKPIVDDKKNKSSQKNDKVLKKIEKRVTGKVNFFLVGGLFIGAFVFIKGYLYSYKNEKEEKKPK